MLYITHIRLDGGDKAQHITHVFWEQPSKDRSNESLRADVVIYIQHGVDVRVRGKGDDIKVVVVDAKPPFLQTVDDDGRETKNLLSLPRF